jgi:hypothetical protein
MEGSAGEEFRAATAFQIENAPRSLPNALLFFRD